MIKPFSSKSKLVWNTVYLNHKLGWVIW